MPMAIEVARFTPTLNAIELGPAFHSRMVRRWPVQTRGIQPSPLQGGGGDSLAGAKQSMRLPNQLKGPPPVDNPRATGAPTAARITRRPPNFPLPP